ncbi:UNVERIFIED_CONTAM: Holliday junction resolvasome, helicase subunit [Acetivibrio alkalicellulosi]
MVDIKAKGQDNEKNGGLENGTYEVIKSRLLKHGNELKERLDRLNDKRKEVFGAIETTILGSERIITENNCVPRDMAPIGNWFIFGYNVHMGLKSKVEIEDVFSIYEYKDRSFHKLNLSLIEDKQFINDFNELYKYYKNTFFAKFTIQGPYLYMIFQTGKSSIDTKVFKWLIKDNKLAYVDNRSDQEVKFSNRQDFDWVRVRREDHRGGKYPHVSIKDRVFVETLRGDLTIKVEDNTDIGKGIYSEPVENKDQTLDDAEILYAILGHIVLLKIRPYKEKNYRYFIYNDKLKSVVRIDAIEDVCMLLPDDHGLIFPKGYYLQSGEYKLFDVPAHNCIFDQKIESPNGEDYQYIFYNTESGIYFVYSYNLIEQSLDTPIVCSGYSHFSSGEMIVFRHEAEPQRNHMIQIWQTPYVGKDYVTHTKNDCLLFKIGNKDIVRAMADCKVVFNLILKGESYSEIYVDIVKESDIIIDSYFWISEQEAFDLKSVMGNIRDTAASAVAEFEKVTRIKEATQKQINDVEEKALSLLKEIEFGNLSTVDEYVGVLSNLRMLRGEIVSLKDLRYTDISLVESLEDKVKQKNEDFSKRCVDFLLTPEGLKPYIQQVELHNEKVGKIEKTMEGKALGEEMSKTSSELELLIDIVTNFKIEDTTKTTEIIDSISSIYSKLNQGKARLKTCMDDLLKTEGSAQFHSQMKLLNHAVVNYLDISDSVDKCDEYLNKVIVQIEELEGKFADFEEYIVDLTEKREELYNAFETKKQSILDRQNKKITALMSAADRLLKGIGNRLNSFNEIEEINGYFASDIMIEKVRDIASQLISLNDTVKSDEIQSRLKTVREDAIRQLKDKQELFVGGKNVVKFGNNLFSVNTKPLDLSMVKKDDGFYFHISGTDFWERVTSQEINKYRASWDQEVLSENKEVYRGEYLTYKIFEAENKNIESLQRYSDQELLEFIQKFMEPRYQESYTKGVHDMDCLIILKELIKLHVDIDLLIYSPSARAFAQLFWKRFASDEMKEKFEIRLKELSKVSLYFNRKPNLSDYLPLVKKSMEQSLCSMTFFEVGLISEASEYLCMELMRGNSFVISMEAHDLYFEFLDDLKDKNAYDLFTDSLKASVKDLEGLYYLIREWLMAFLVDREFDNVRGLVDEVAVMFILNGYDARNLIQTKTSLTIKDLSGSHPIIKNGEYILSYTEFMKKLQSFEKGAVPDYINFQELKKKLIQECKDELRMDEFKTGVLSSFVRSQLIDKVYLPLIGHNLAKQIGVAGENKRTDLMGMLLLISPPGYGKTTLMEYVANRLGITLIKINGPALGHEVTSLDPESAKNASAKEELRKLNLAFKMGNNIMIYVDDIQHCNPEFLQKFIPLCDGQRKIEGVYKGVGQSYDLRGKKVAVVMAGNPYTESGDKFQIPDMLSNRADVYNLGDMTRENNDAFILSFIENSLTSNPVLSKLSNRSRKDIYSLIEIAQGSHMEDMNFEGNYSIEEINEFTDVFKKLIKVRDVVLKINMEYIRSAAQADEYRTEPPFKLQGSYRNMNKIAEKIVAVMNDDEVNELVISAYENDSQTLTTGAEANMLKWKELVGCLNEEEKVRWEEIKVFFNKNKLVKGDDKVGQAVLMLENIKEVLAKGVEKKELENLVEIMTELKDMHSNGVQKFVERISQGKK